MLDFTSLMIQIERMIEEKKNLKDNFADKINLAYSELKLRSRNWEELSKKVKLSKTSWLLAGILSPLDITHCLPSSPSTYTVFSSDGSQIFPDRHEAIPCYLINIGSVSIHYGAEGAAELNSFPKFFYKDEDRLVYWGGRKIPVDSLVISERRTLMEFQELLKLADVNKNQENAIAICDGTLIFWRLEGTPADFKKEIMVPFLDVMDRLRSLRVPIAGYISFPGSTDVMNSLRVGLCPDKISRCNQCPYTHLQELPCASIEGITDKILLSRVLKRGERSSVFESSSRILELYGDHRVCFFYLNIGEEIARVEIPEWVAEDKELLNLVHAVVYDQAKKGNGYPVAIAEAHEKAIVRAKERDFFFDRIREALIKSDFKVTVSRKSLSKRSPGV